MKKTSPNKITYALSAGSFGRRVTPAAASACRQNGRVVWFLENCEKIVPQIKNFRLPGN